MRYSLGSRKEHIALFFLSLLQVIFLRLVEEWKSGVRAFLLSLSCLSIHHFFFMTQDSSDKHTAVLDSALSHEPLLNIVFNRFFSNSGRFNDS